MGKKTNSWSIIALNFGLNTVIEVEIIPRLILKYGYLNSFLVTMVIFFIIGVVSVTLYDIHKKDIFKIEALKENPSLFYNNSGSNKLIKFILKWEQKSRLLFIIILSFKNPGLFVLYFRKGVFLFNGFSDRKIGIYFLGIIILISSILIGLEVGVISIWKLIFI